MELFAGEVFDGKRLAPGFAALENGILEVHPGETEDKPDRSGVLIIPPPINMHTHVGDAFIAERGIELPRDIMELVAPPHGLKHRLLAEAGDDEVTNGIEKCIGLMENRGTAAFCDFREGGRKGAALLLDAASGFSTAPFVLGRPAGTNYDVCELEGILKIADGIGISSMSDWDYDELQKVADHAKRSGKLFALHASERVREDIDLILALMPDFLVHMAKGTRDDFGKLATAGVPVVVCPRSNEFFGIWTPLCEMLDAGVEVMLGTDNAMLFEPDILAEAAHAMAKWNLSVEEVLYMICARPRKVLNPDAPFQNPVRGANYIVVERNLDTVVVSP
ncbi:MAG: deaminase [Thermoplasmata archaeon HGW-Thermoplasmata-1]|nr:MAG: deaminase [Thermoplasmata archaeon HGW-Thermoplasmata-1]